MEDIIKLSEMMTLSANANNGLKLKVTHSTTKMLVFNYRFLPKSYAYAKDNYGFVIYECFKKDKDIQFSLGNTQYYPLSTFKEYKKDFGTLTIPEFTTNLNSGKLYALGLLITGTENQNTTQGKADLASIAYFIPGSTEDVPDTETTVITLDRDFVELESLLPIKYSIPMHTQAGTPDMCKHFVRIYKTQQENLFLDNIQLIGEELIDLNSYEGKVFFKDVYCKDLEHDQTYTLAYCHSRAGHKDKDFVATSEFAGSVV